MPGVLQNLSCFDGNVERLGRELVRDCLGCDCHLARCGRWCPRLDPRRGGRCCCLFSEQQVFWYASLGVAVLFESFLAIVAVGVGHTFPLWWRGCSSRPQGKVLELSCFKSSRVVGCPGGLGSPLGYLCLPLNVLLGRDGSFFDSATLFKSLMLSLPQQWAKHPAHRRHRRRVMLFAPHLGIEPSMASFGGSPVPSTCDLAADV